MLGTATDVQAQTQHGGRRRELVFVGLQISTVTVSGPGRRKQRRSGYAIFPGHGDGTFGDSRFSMPPDSVGWILASVGLMADGKLDLAVPPNRKTLTP